MVVRECPIELCQFLKFSGVTGSGGEAKQLIADGLVQLNGVVETRKRKKLDIGDEVLIAGERLRVAIN